MPHHPFELPFYTVVCIPRKLFLPFQKDGVAIGHEPWSLSSSRDGHRVPMTFSDNSNHTAKQRSIGDLTVETRFYPHQG